MSDQRIILFTFAGREENMRVQAPYLERLLRDWPGLEVHHWDLTRNDADHAYVQSLHNPEGRVIVHSQFWPGDNDWPIGCRKKMKRARWCGCRDCRPAPFEKPYAWYAERTEYADAVFVKMDDDIVFIETDRFGEVLVVLATQPQAVVSANVVNNVVSAKHDPELRPVVEDRFSPTTQREWFDLHASADYARLCHDWFLSEWRSRVYPPQDWPAKFVTRSFPGERVSINTIAFTYATLLRLNATIQHPRFARMGDEGAIVHNFLPRITVSFRTAHLYFGPQRVAMTDAELDDYRGQYAAVAEEYLR